MLGTPGTGKSTLSEQVAESTGLDWVDVGSIAKQEKLYEGYDSTYGCHVLNEERVCPYYHTLTLSVAVDNSSGNNGV